MSQQINLLNPAFEPNTTPFSARAMAIAGAVLAFGLAAMAVSEELRVLQLQAEAGAGATRLAAAQKRLDQVNAEFHPRPRDPAIAAALQAAEQHYAALRHVAGLIEHGDLGSTQGYAEYFRALARQSVDGLWLTGVSIGDAGRDIGVQGRALDAALVPGFLGRLRSEPVLQGKAVGSLRIGEAATAKAAGKDGAAPAPFVEFSLQSTPAGAKP